MTASNPHPDPWGDASALALVSALEAGNAAELDPKALAAPWGHVARLARGTNPLPGDGAIGFARSLTPGWCKSNDIASPGWIEERVWDIQTHLNGAPAAEYMARAKAAGEAAKWAEAADRVLKDPDRTTRTQGIMTATGLGESGRESIDEDAFWTARPELAHIRTFARARMTSPWAVAGIVLARIVAATPPAVLLPPIVGGRASLNLAVGIVGRSGSGKGAAEAAARDALSLGVRLNSFDTHKIGSGQGIAHGYARRNKKGEVERIADACLFRIDEVDQIAGNASQRGSTLLPELRSGLMGEALGSLYVDPTRRLEIAPQSYRFAVTVGIQPARSGVLLDDADGGTPQRFLWLPATDPDAPDDTPDEPAPITWQPPRWATELPVCDTARTQIIAARRAELRGQGEPLDGHRLLLREKTAAALDILAGHAGVTDEAWELAGVILAISDQTRGECQTVLTAKADAANTARGRHEGRRAAIADEEKAERATEGACRALLRTLERRGEMASGDLRRSLRITSRNHYEDAIERLTAAGQITAEQTGQGVRYRRA